MSCFVDYSLEDCTLVDEHGIRWMKEGLCSKNFLRTRFKMRRKFQTSQEYLRKYTNDFPWGLYCLEHGTTSNAESYRTIRNRIDGRGFMEEGHCYRSSMRVLRRWSKKRPDWVGNQTVSYVEGLALDPTGVFLHGWIDVGGVAYDLTFKRAYMTTYFGVHFDPSKVGKAMEKIGKYGLFHNWKSSRLLLEDARISVQMA